MGILRILLAMALVAGIIAVIIKLLPSQDGGKSNAVCDKCGGTGRIEELRGKVPCPKCKGTGKANW